MKSTIDELEKIIKEDESKFNKSKKYIELKNYYDKMKSLGLIFPREYDIPPIDTIGRKFYQNQNK